MHRQRFSLKDLSLGVLTASVLPSQYSRKLLFVHHHRGVFRRDWRRFQGLLRGPRQRCRGVKSLTIDSFAAGRVGSGKQSVGLGAGGEGGQRQFPHLAGRGS